MGNNNKTISKEAFEALKKQLIETSEIDLNINKGYNALADYINEKARENYPAPTNENGKVIQYKEHISPDTIRRYWGKKSSNKINNPRGTDEAQSRQTNSHGASFGVQRHLRVLRKEWI